jgi:hypothetical protein
MRCVTHCETIDVDLPVAWHRRGFRFVWACTKDVHLQLAGRRSDVDTLGQTQERDTERPELLEEHDQMSLAATEPVEAPADQHIESPPFGIAH